MAKKEAATSERVKASLQTQIDQTDEEIAQIIATRNSLMLTCINYTGLIYRAEVNIQALIIEIAATEATFASTMGSLLQDGYFSDDTYAAGQEAALYNDAVAVLDVLSKPQSTYQ